MASLSGILQRRFGTELLSFKSYEDMVKTLKDVGCDFIERKGNKVFCDFYGESKEIWIYEGKDGSVKIVTIYQGVYSGLW